IIFVANFGGLRRFHLIYEWPRPGEFGPHRRRVNPLAQRISAMRAQNVVGIGRGGHSAVPRACDIWTVPRVAAIALMPPDSNRRTRARAPRCPASSVSATTVTLLVKPGTASASAGIRLALPATQAPRPVAA